jgi:hypothetical protein
MDIFKRNIFTTILMFPYFYGWYFVIDWFTSVHAKYPQSCGAANAGMLVLLLLIITIYSLTMLVNIIVRKGQGRSDSIKFLLIVIIPVILLYFGATVYAMISNHTPPETNLHEFK